MMIETCLCEYIDVTKFSDPYHINFIMFSYRISCMVYMRSMIQWCILDAGFQPATLESEGMVLPRDVNLVFSVKFNKGLYMWTF